MKKTESERQIRGERRYQCPSCITSFWSEVHRKPHDIHLCTKISIDMQGIFFRLQFVCIFFFKQVAVSIEIVQRTQYCIAFSPFWMCHPSICGTRWVWLFFWFACLLFIWMWVTWSFPFFASSRLHFYRAMLANTWVRCWVVSSVFNKCVNSKQNYFLTKLAHVDSCV